MTCETALPLLYDLVDGDIGRDAAVSVALHVGSCPACAATLGQIRTAEEFYAAKTPVPPPPELAGRIAAAVRKREPRRALDARTLGIAAAAAAASAAALFAVERSAPGALTDTASRIGAATAQLLAAVRLPDATSGLAAAWSQLAAWLAAPAVLGSGVALLAGLIVLQVGGSAVLLAARRRGGRP
jgi:predicted anti-sigma-YlaC factor YlaD